MTVYEKIENTCSLSAYWNALLKLNTGIILKNRLQLRISEGNVSFSDYENYKKTEEFFKFVYHYAKTCDDVLLQLEIQAELIELCAIAQYFQINSVSSARNYITEMEKTLKKYPVPLRRIQYYRMLARVQILEKNYEKGIGEARKAVNMAEQQGEHDSLLYHIYGMSIRKFVEQKLYEEAKECKQFNESKLLEEKLIEIKNYLSFASEQFEKVRSTNNKIAGYVSDIEMCIAVVDFGKELYNK